MAAKVDLEKLDFDELKTLAKDIEEANKKACVRQSEQGP
jgi:hypothetical protein